MQQKWIDVKFADKTVHKWLIMHFAFYAFIDFSSKRHNEKPIKHLRIYLQTNTKTNSICKCIYKYNF